MSPPPPTTDRFEAPDDLLPVKTEAFTFHTPKRDARDDAPARTPNTEITVGTLVPFDLTDIAGALDDDTQQMLEADYEAELTRTQQLDRKLAERALARGSDEDLDVTVRMAGNGDADETLEMPGGDDELDGATVAHYVGAEDSHTDAGRDTQAPDLDLDLPGTTAVLEDGARALAEELGEDFEIEAEDTPREKRA